MKVLSSYPGGLGSVTDLTRDLKILVSSGSDWAQRTKLMASTFDALDIFGAGFVERYSFGWRLTEKGLAALNSMESKIKRNSTAVATTEPQRPADHKATTVTPRPPQQEPAPVRRSHFAVIEGGRLNSPAKSPPIVRASK